MPIKAVSPGVAAVRRAFALVTLLLVAGAAWAEGLGTAPGTVATRGGIDLSGLARGKASSLEGEWEFHWRSFVDPSSLAAGQVPSPAFGRLPGEWAGYGRGYPPTGYGTYRLLVKGLDPKRDWGLRMGSFLSAARVFVNGREVMSFGKPGKDAASEEPGWYSQLILLHPTADGVADIVVHLSNFADRSGGLRTAMALGEYTVVQGIRDRIRLYELFSVGALIIMGLYYLFLHAFRPADRPPLLFGLLCLALGLRIICYDEYFLLDLIPNLSWPWLFRIGYLTFSLSVLLTTMFIAKLFPKRAWKPLTWLVAAISIAYSLFICVGDTLSVSLALQWFQAFTVVAGLYLVIVLVIAILARERGALLFLGGFLLFFAAAVFDIFVANGMIKSTFVAQYGLLVFVFSMSLVITRKLAGAFSMSESLSAELVRANRAMKRFVPEEFLAMLGKSSVEQVGLGDNAKQDMAVMFADIRAFTSLSERLSPEETFRFINQYLARMGPTIRSNNGFVDKYMGDGIMALFPGSREDAARCAIDMHQRLDEYNLQRQGQDEEPIRIGIGIHFGGIMLGTIGENERMDGTVIADAVNVASRMEGIAKEFGVGVVASESILMGLADRSEYRSRFLGKVGVKGKREQVPVFELYDGDPEELRARKDEIRVPFEAALGSFYVQDYVRALGLLKEVSTRLPDDEACNYYMRLIRKLNSP